MKELNEAAKNIKKIMVCELNTGQMITDVELAIKCKVPCVHYGRTGGVVPDPADVIKAAKETFK